MLDAKNFDALVDGASKASGTPLPVCSAAYLSVKRSIDLLAVLVFLPVTAIVALVVMALNPIFNKGTLLYAQKRMGRDGVAFIAYKFRSMTEASPVSRGAFDALERDRITILGALMRKLRIDELPQIINVLKGDMSLVGPRPDFYDHAQVYMEAIPGYHARYSVRPGITGLAQINVGYVSDESGFRKKVAADLMYIRNMSIFLDLKILMKTVLVVFARHGS